MYFLKLIFERNEQIKMSVLPYILEELLPSNNYYRNHHNHHGDLWITPAECAFPCNLNPTGYLRSALSNLDELEKQAKIGKDGFQACLDVQHFQPNEISVETVDNSIVVEANHEERKDSHGYISRRFSRRYELPEGYKAKDVMSSISSDGVLSIKCPKTEPAVEGNVRHIQIQQTGPARLNVANKNEEKNTAKGQQQQKNTK